LTPPPREKTKGKVVCDKGCEIPSDLMAGDTCPSCGGILFLPPTDWGMVFGGLMREFNMDYDKILERTFPQIEAILESLGSSDDDNNDNEPEEEHSIMDGQAFAALFAGLN